MLKRYQRAKYEPTLSVSPRSELESSSATAAAPPEEESANEVAGAVLFDDGFGWKF